jgi:ribonuclease HI
MNAAKMINIYTDGAASGNPGPGGWAAVINLGGHKKEISGGFLHTTNNRMELYAAIASLEFITDPTHIVLYSDSLYLVESIIKGRVESWRKRGWKHTRNRAVPNADLWQRLMKQLERHIVRFEWVEGHAGHPENERANLLAQRALFKPGLPVDEGFTTAANGIQPDLFAEVIESRTARDSRGTTSHIEENNAPKATPGGIGKLGKVTKEGQACRKCGTAVVKKIPMRRVKGKQKFYYAYYLSCPNCGTMYLVDEAKRIVK